MRSCSVSFIGRHSQVKQMIPRCFKPHFIACRVIINCTKVPCAVPNNTRAKVLMYSYYKGCYWAKFMVGITPNGIISFLSRLYGGRTTGPFITIDCVILHLLNRAYLVLTDKGFPQIRRIPNSCHCTAKPDVHAWGRVHHIQFCKR